MMNVIQLLPGITLRCFPERRFKRGFLSLQFIRPMCREENALNGLLPSVLLRGTRQCPDIRAVTARLDDLYGGAVGGSVRRIGDYQAVGLSAGFIDDRFAMTGDRVLEPMLEFCSQLVLDPALEDSLFRRDVVETEKKNLVATIEASLNNKRQYAVLQLLKLMCREDTTGIPRLGEPEQVEAITPEALTCHYRKLLETSPMEIFYVGGAGPEQVAQVLRKTLSCLDRKPEALPPQGPFRDGGNQWKQEEMPVNQGRLCLGFVTPITLRDDRVGAMKVCNGVLGGSMISKLFMVIREQLSLCYDIDSEYSGTKGILTVTAGVDSGNFDLVREKVLEQLEACKAGRITEKELLAAKERHISALKRVYDSGSGMEGYYMGTLLSGLNQTPEEAIARIQEVTAEQVAQAAATLRLHTEYYLKGVQE